MMNLFATALHCGVTFEAHGSVLPGKAILTRRGLPVWAGDLNRMPVLNDSDGISVNPADYVALATATQGAAT